MNVKKTAIFVLLLVTLCVILFAILVALASNSLVAMPDVTQVIGFTTGTQSNGLVRVEFHCPPVAPALYVRISRIESQETTSTASTFISHGTVSVILLDEFGSTKAHTVCNATTKLSRFGGEWIREYVDYHEFFENNSVAWFSLFPEVLQPNNMENKHYLQIAWKCSPPENYSIAVYCTYLRCGLAKPPRQKNKWLFLSH